MTKILSYSTDLCLLKKKLNVHGKYKFNYVHYVIDETNWDEILTKSNHKTNKNNISPLRLKEILERLIAGYDMKTVSNIVGFKSRSIYNLFDRITIETKRGYAKYQKKCKLCGMDLKGKTIYVISALKFLNLIETRHDSKRLENNSKLLMKYIDIFKFYKQLLYFYLKNRNSFNLDSKAVKQSVASIIFKYIRELEAQGKLQNSYVPSVQNFYRILAKHSAFGLKLDILPYKSNGKYGSRTTVKHETKKKTIGKLITERPESVNLRLNDNDYEMDTVIGLRSDNYCILTLINRKSRMFYCTLSRRNAKAIKENLEKLIKDNNLVIDTLTIDNGSKNYKLPEIESIKEIFHCHPYSSSEKGSIENAHRLLRRYIPKGKSIDKYVGQDLKPIADFINSHPRIYKGVSGFKCAKQMQ